MKTNAMKKFYLGAAAAASLGMLGSAVSAAPTTNYLGEACIAATCVDLATGGYNVSGGAVIDPAESLQGFYKTPGEDTGNEGAVLSYNVTSSANVPEGASTPVSVTGLNSSFDFYWGSIDSFNFIDFYTDGAVTHTIGGTEVANGTPVHFNTDGYFSFLGTKDYSFDQVVLRSEEGIAFEFATAAVPEPGTLALLGLGLAGLGAARRRKLAA